jgi:hypothetical protein
MREKKIEVNLHTRVLRYFEGTEEELKRKDFSPLLTYSCVIGNLSKPTPVGTFKVWKKEVCWYSRSPSIEPLGPVLKSAQTYAFKKTAVMNFGVGELGILNGVANYALAPYERNLSCPEKNELFKKGHKITEKDILREGFMPFALFFKQASKEQDLDGYAIHAGPSYFNRAMMFGGRMGQIVPSPLVGSLGCVRLYWEDAKTLYSFVDLDTTVVIIVGVDTTPSWAPK